VSFYWERHSRALLRETMLIRDYNFRCGMFNGPSINGVVKATLVVSDSIEGSLRNRHCLHLFRLEYPI